MVRSAKKEGVREAMNSNSGSGSGSADPSSLPDEKRNFTLSSVLLIG